MRFLGFAVVTGAAILLGACGGGDSATTDTAAAAAPAADSAPAAAAAPAGAPAAITGTTHTINMVGDGQGYRYEPAEITIKAGDGIRFVMVSGGPHNVAFDPATLSPEAKSALLANMPEQAGELSGKMLLNPDEAYVVSFANVPAGTYDFFCTPHLAMNMKGKVTVQ
ncbi:plastocyanin/azurin family copper-binding protein [Gemmatimonas sp. UBA7669]|uniref:plastocyanin/azurin family copper-binding protein n=1 Tax=Gemmatimonas sp. UBA7669 TaxID=1946568 RepID=UPI0025BFD9B6|nr:plastocyanin/azurin family copper-binding protein [Gemmatimonas sp. UBA7669]